MPCGDRIAGYVGFIVGERMKRSDQTPDDHTSRPAGDPHVANKTYDDRPSGCKVQLCSRGMERQRRV